MLSQSSGIKVYQGVYRGSPVVVRVRLAHVADPGRPLATLRVACVGGLAQPVSVDWRSLCRWTGAVAAGRNHNALPMLGSCCKCFYKARTCCLPMSQVTYGVA